MKKAFARRLILLLSLVLICALAACGGGDTPAPSGANDPGASQTDNSSSGSEGSFKESDLKAWGMTGFTNPDGTSVDKYEVKDYGMEIYIGNATYEQFEAIGNDIFNISGSKYGKGEWEGQTISAAAEALSPGDYGYFHFANDEFSYQIDYNNDIQYKDQPNPNTVRIMVRKTNE